MNDLWVIVLIAIAAILVSTTLIFPKYDRKTLVQQQPGNNPEDKPCKRRRRRHRSKKRHAEHNTGDKPEAEFIRPKQDAYEPGTAVEGCPNRVNPHHECTPYCFQRWNQRHPSFTDLDGRTAPDTMNKLTPVF